MSRRSGLQDRSRAVWLYVTSQKPWTIIRAGKENVELRYLRYLVAVAEESGEARVQNA
jgi:hypothetical protein